MNVHSTQHELLLVLAIGIRNYLEVGVQEGKSLQIVGFAGLPRYIALCDTWESESGGSGRGSHEHIDTLIAELPYTPNVQYFDGDSREMLPKLTGFFDLVHIDGGHSYEVALSDFREGWRMCTGAMVVHDISFPDVWRAFYTFMQDAFPQRVDCFFGGHGTAVVRR